MPQHVERRFMPYSSDQMFDLVAEVECYPEFLPWCLGTRVTRRVPGEPGIVEADMLIGFMMLARALRLANAASPRPSTGSR